VQALQRHTKICKKVFINKREAFDSKNARKTEEQIALERKESNNNFQRKSQSKKKSQVEVRANVEEKPLKKMPKWKMQSEQFRRAMHTGSGSRSS